MSSSLKVSNRQASSSTSEKTNSNTTPPNNTAGQPANTGTSGSGNNVANSSNNNANSNKNNANNKSKQSSKAHGGNHHTNMDLIEENLLKKDVITPDDVCSLKLITQGEYSFRRLPLSLTLNSLYE